MEGFRQAFRLEEDSGRLFWQSPPPQHAEKVGKEAGYVNTGKGNNKTYWQIRYRGKTYKRSRVVFYMTHGRWPTPCVDHINGDSLDDRPCNLREATYTENAQNSALHRGKKSGLPQGVHPYRQSYRAVITVNKKRFVLGQFSDPSDASEAYQLARREHFHAFA